MNIHSQCRLARLSAVGLLCAAVACPLPTFAQTDNADGVLQTLEEVVVTGRKREESLQEIPVAISVLGSDMIAELNVLRQDDLAALVPGYFYNQGVGLNEDRTAALPSIRGIGSTELATNRSKVASFVDGMPILGSVGAINIGGATQVEVYSGPQSAAFGRSTFAGAINYVTRDPGEELNGTIGMNYSNEGTRIVNGSVGGPITDTLGFQLGAIIEDSASPDTPLYSYTDGVEAITETGENLSARLVFEPNNQFKAKLTFARDTTDDGPRADFYAAPEDAFNCYSSGNLYAFYSGMGPMTNIGWDGPWECKLEVHPETVLEQLNDYFRYFNANPDVLTSIADDLRAQGAVDGHLGLTVEEQAAIIYDGYSVHHGQSGSESERDRIMAQFDYVMDNGSGWQLSFMRSEEDLFRGYSRVAEQEVQPVYWNPNGGYYDQYANLAHLTNPMAMQNGRRVPDNAPTTIEENYMEVRWASPGEDRLRYVVGAAYYDYEYIFTDYGAPGYVNLTRGTADLFAQLIDPSELTNSGGIVAPTTIASEVTTNTALFFNASYDFTDTLTGSIEGRYASDDVGAVLESPVEDTLRDSVKTDTFTPRIALNWTPNDNTTYYAQYSVGVNPAGINANMLDPLLRATLDIGVFVDDTVYGGSVMGNVTTVNYDSSRYASFDEEELTNYELGFKGTALDGRLTYTGAVYYMVWENALENIALDWDYTYADDDLAGLSVFEADGSGPTDVYYVPETDDTSINQILTNIGKSDTQGVELQMTYYMGDNWTISGNASYMQRKFTDYCSEDDYLGFDGSTTHPEPGVHAGLTEGVSAGGNPCWILDGLEVPDQPSFTMTLLPTYRTEFANGMRFNATLMLRHIGQHYRDFVNITETPAVDRVNLRLGLSTESWTGTLYIDNLLDDTNLTPRGVTSQGRFNQLNAPAVLPPQYLFPFMGATMASFRFNRNVGRTAGIRFNYNF